MSDNLKQRVHKAVGDARIVDLHTHLFAPQMGSLNLWGIDELLTYHYLIAESLRMEPSLEPENYFSWTKTVQAEFVWQKLFVERLPLSEATLGVITVLKKLGFDPNKLKLASIRQDLDTRDPIKHVDEVLSLAKIDCLAMTNDPFDNTEEEFWHNCHDIDPRFLFVLRIDSLFKDLATVEPYFLNREGNILSRARRFLDARCVRDKPRYMAASLPPDFDFTTPGPQADAFHRAVMPACEDHSIPMALMIGVRRQVNPRLGQAGDAMGVADLTKLEDILVRYPKQKFLVTTLARENAQNLIVLARKFANLTVFGCWWFMNNPSLIEEVTDMRLEMIGTDFIPQHSDARILEQVIYKWKHSRVTIADCLHKRFKALADTGFTITDDQIKTEADRLLNINARIAMRLTN